MLVSASKASAQVTLVYDSREEYVPHVKGVRLVKAGRVSNDVKREIIARWQDGRKQYPSLTHFARAEEERLAFIGIQYRASAIVRIISYHGGQTIQSRHWETLLRMLRAKNPRTGEFWYDHGDMTRLGTALRINRNMRYLQEKGYEIRRRRTDFETLRERGWQWEYRLWEAQP